MPSPFAQNVLFSITISDGAIIRQKNPSQLLCFLVVPIFETKRGFSMMRKWGYKLIFLHKNYCGDNVEYKTLFYLL